MINKPIRLLLLIVFLVTLLTPLSLASGETAVVHAVLFYSPSCPHCQQVIIEDLPPLIEQYEDQLLIIGIDTSVPEGAQLYQAAIARFQIPENRRGVPTMIVGDDVLVGVVEIPQQFPAIIETGLASGGIDWPEIPGFQELIEASSNQAAEETSPENNQENLTIGERFRRDLSGNILAVVVLAGMFLSSIWVGVTIAKPNDRMAIRWPDWVIPVLTVIGLIVAAYLSYVEFTLSEAVCGPVGDCNTVQQSIYAYLFGIIPIGILGIVGYSLIGISWLIQRFGSENWKNYAAVVLWLFAAIGTAFSIYLTILEPFVIGATCAWCITSAIVITLILLTATGPALIAWSKIRNHKNQSH
jgi:uncharacterized membrane protein